MFSFRGWGFGQDPGGSFKVYFVFGRKCSWALGIRYLGAQRNIKATAYLPEAVYDACPAVRGGRAIIPD